MKKIVEVKNIKRLLGEITNKKTVLAGGCFDIFHKGHIKFLEEAKKRGDILIVLLESDENIKKNKGKERPINDQESRAVFLNNLRVVDYVVKLSGINKDEDYSRLVNEIKPKVIAMSEGDEKANKKLNQAKKVGAELVTVNKLIAQQSTSRIIQKVLNKE